MFQSLKRLLRNIRSLLYGFFAPKDKDKKTTSPTTHTDSLKNSGKHTEKSLSDFRALEDSISERKAEKELEILEIKEKMKTIAVEYAKKEGKIRKDYRPSAEAKKPLTPLFAKVKSLKGQINQLDNELKTIIKSKLNFHKKSKNSHKDKLTSSRRKQTGRSR